MQKYTFFLITLGLKNGWRDNLAENGWRDSWLEIVDMERNGTQKTILDENGIHGLTWS